MAHEVQAERSRLVGTLRAVEPGAPTTAGDWTAETIARHLAAQDRLSGLPALLARSIAVRTRLRLSEPYLRSQRLASLLNGRPKSWEWSLERLSRPPPAAVLRPLIAPITLWEHFVHHEDVRRPNRIPRAAQPDLVPVVQWLLTYNRSRLRGASTTVTRIVGGQWKVTLGSDVWLVGDLGELVLWLSGRPATTDISLSGDRTAIGALRERLRV